MAPSTSHFYNTLGYLYESTRRFPLASRCKRTCTTERMQRVTTQFSFFRVLVHPRINIAASSVVASEWNFIVTRRNTSRRCIRSTRNDYDLEISSWPGRVCKFSDKLHGHAFVKEKSSHVRVTKSSRDDCEHRCRGVLDEEWRTRSRKKGWKIAKVTIKRETNGRKLRVPCRFFFLFLFFFGRINPEGV